MNKQQLFRDPFAFIILGGIIFLMISLFGTYFDENPTPYLQGIENDYKAGEEAKTPLQRKEAFNRSLESLLTLEERYRPTHGNGILYLNIGNNFYQLEDYPRAILYYNKALALRPRDENVAKLLEAAQAKINIIEKPNSSVLKKLFFIQSYYSIPEQLQIFTFLTAMAVASASAYLWFKRQWIYSTFIVSIVIGSLIFLGLIATYYFSPLEGVIIRSSALYRDAGDQYAKVIDDPLPSGQKVTIINLSPNGKWLKIETGNGVFGYVPYESLQMI